VIGRARPCRRCVLDLQGGSSADQESEKAAVTGCPETPVPRKCAPDFLATLLCILIKIANLTIGSVSLDATIHNVCVTGVDVSPTWEGPSGAGHDIAAWACHLSEALYKSSTSRSLEPGSSLLALG
jgi:hypothetical protein